MSPAQDLTGIILVLPARLAGPAAAEHALAELRDRVGRVAEVAHVLREAARVLLPAASPCFRITAISDFSSPRIEGFLTFWRFCRPVLFPEVKACLQG